MLRAGMPENADSKDYGRKNERAAQAKNWGHIKNDLRMALNHVAEHTSHKTIRRGELAPHEERPGPLLL